MQVKLLAFKLRGHTYVARGHPEALMAALLLWMNDARVDLTWQDTLPIVVALSEALRTGATGILTVAEPFHPVEG